MRLPRTEERHKSQANPPAQLFINNKKTKGQKKMRERTLQNEKVAKTFNDGMRQKINAGKRFVRKGFMPVGGIDGYCYGDISVIHGGRCRS